MTVSLEWAGSWGSDMVGSQFPACVAEGKLRTVSPVKRPLPLPPTPHPVFSCNSYNGSRCPGA